MQLLKTPTTLTALRHDGQLLHQFTVEQDEAAFVELLRRHGAMVLGVCRRILHQQQDAEDATQAVFLSLAQQATKLSTTHSVAAWLHCVARRTAGHALRQAQQRLKREQRVARPETITAHDADAVRWLLDEELDRLPERYRLPVLLCCIEGHTRQTAAELLGWPAGTVAGRLGRARAILQKRLTARGVALAAATGVMMPSGASAFPCTLATLLRSQAMMISRGKGLTEIITPSVAAMLAGVHGVAWSARFSLALLACLMLLAGGWLTTRSEPLASTPSPSAATKEEKGAEADSAQPLFAGTVYADGKSVAGTKVWLSMKVMGVEKKHLVTDTDQQGRFSFSVDPNGIETYTLYARSPDGRFEYVDNAALTRSPSWQQLSIDLLATSQAKGKLLDHDGQPLAGLTLKPTSLYFGDYLSEYLNPETGKPQLWVNRTRSLSVVPEFLQAYWTVTTAADGSFIIPSLPYQSAVVANLSIKPEANLTLVLNSRETSNIELPKPGRVLVRQVDVEGALSLKGAEINCSSVTEGTNYTILHQLKGTMENKPLVFEPVYAGMQTTIKQTSFGESPAYVEEPRLILHPSPGQASEVTLKAKSGVTIKGRVVHEGTNKPLANAKLTIVNDDARQGPRTRWDSTNNDGYYQGYAVPGTINVFLLLPEVGLVNDQRCPPVKGKGTAGQTITMPDLVLKAAKSLEGEVVTADGKPVPQAHVFSFVTERSRPNLLTDAYGKFTINNLSEDEIVLFARTEVGVVSGPVVVDLATPAPKATLTLDPQANFFVTGRFVNRQGKPLAALPVHLEWVLRGTGQLSQMSTKKRLMNTTTDADGRFRFGPLWPGQRYFVKNQSNQLSGYESPPIIGKAGETEALGNIAIEQSNSIVQGRIVDSQGQPLAGVVVTNRADGPRLAKATTDAEGRFTLNNLFDKEAWVVARMKGYHLAASPVDLTTGKGEVNLTLKRTNERSEVSKVDLADDFQRLANYHITKLLDMPAEKLDGHHPSVLRELARYQPAPAQAWLAKRAAQDAKTYGPASVYALCLKEGLAFHDALHGNPTEALKRLKTIDPNNRAYWFYRNLPAVIKLAPAAARQLLPAFAEVGREATGRDQVHFLAAASHFAWKLGDEAQAKTLAEEAAQSAETFSAESEQKCYTRHTAASAIIRFDRLRAMKLIEPIKQHTESVRWYYRALEECIPPLAERDLPAALKLMKEFNTPDAQFHQPIAEIKLALAVARKDPEEAEKFARTITSSDNARIEAHLWLARELGTTHPEVAARCLEEAYRQLDADRLPPTPYQMMNYRYVPWQLAGLGAAIAAELKHPQQADWSALVVAHRGTIKDPRSPIGQMEGQVSASRLLALSDPLTARQLLAEAIPVEGQFGAGTWGFHRPDWLFAQALADPEHGQAWIDLAIHRLHEKGNDRSMSYGLIELAEILTSPPALRLGATLGMNNQFYLREGGKP